MKLTANAISRPYVYPLYISIASLLIFYGLKLSYLSFTGLETLFAGVCTASVASYITVVLVDSTFREQEQRRRERMEKIALEELSGYVNSHIGLLSDMYIASSLDYPEDTPEDYPQLFDEEFAKQIQLLDFSKDYPTARGGIQWFKYSENNLKEFRESIDQVLSQYSYWIDAETARNLRELKQTTFISMIITASESNLVQFDNQEGYDRTYTMLAGHEDITLEHLDLLLKIINKYNEQGIELTNVEKLGAWQQNVAPQPESGRVEEQQLIHAEEENQDS